MSLIEKLDFGDVASDIEFTGKAVDLNNAILNIQKHVRLIEENKTKVEDMNIEDRINYKLFSVYAINSLCWIQLRSRGADPNSHPVKQQLLRIRQLMQKKDELVDRKNRPVLNKNAAKRFIRSGLWDPKEQQANKSGQPNKKIKFTDS